MGEAQSSFQLAANLLALSLTSIMDSFPSLGLHYYNPLVLATIVSGSENYSNFSNGSYFPPGSSKIISLLRTIMIIENE